MQISIIVLIVRAHISLAGVTLVLHGVTIPNDSFVDLDDVMYTAPGTHLSDLPSNRNPRDESLQCITDLVDCCGTEPDTPSNITRTVHGDWYFPNGTAVGFGGGTRFLVNRGPNEVIGYDQQLQQFNGSVRLYRRYGNPPGRGRFHCELPSAANPSVNQTLYANICEFHFICYS